MTKEFIIERTNEDHSFSVVASFDTCEEAINALKKIESNLRHEVWSDGWINTDHGYRPIAWIN